MDMVTVPKRIVDLLTQIQKYGTIARASELQEVYRLIAAHSTGTQDEKKSCVVQDECVWSVCRRKCVIRDSMQPQPTTDADWSEFMSSVQDADGRVTPVTLQVGEVTTRMVPASEPITDAARDVLSERQRQISEEGAKPEEDDAYKDHELARAAIAYARSGIGLVSDGNVPTQWPWMTHWWKPTTPRRDLVKAAALILAEIERLDRAKGE